MVFNNSSSVGNATRPGTDDLLYLIGRPPAQGDIGFLTKLVANPNEIDASAIMDQWRLANNRVQQLSVQEAGWADGPFEQPLDTRLAELADRVKSSALYQKAYGLTPFDIRMVELDRLVVFQKHINLEHVRRLDAELGDNPTDEQIFCLCLPMQDDCSPVQSMQTGEASFVLSSPSNDFRILDLVVLNAEQVQGYQSRGRMVAIVGAAVGYSANSLSAVHFGSRLLLLNGSHRAYALRSKGITHAPCLIQRVSRPDEFGLVLAPEQLQNVQAYFVEPRPIVLKDYFDPALCAIAKVIRKNKQAEVSLAAQLRDVPA